MRPSNDNVAPIDVTALAVFILGASLFVGLPAASLWLWSVWS